MFNGLMQIPGRERRRQALQRIGSLCKPQATLLFTTHDRDFPPDERSLWEAESSRWEKGTHDPRLTEFGDRHFVNESGEVFIHIPNRGEILEDLTFTGWAHEFDVMRSQMGRESKAVTEFSDDCRFWVARRR